MRTSPFIIGAVLLSLSGQTEVAFAQEPPQMSENNDAVSQAKPSGSMKKSKGKQHMRSSKTRRSRSAR